MRCSPLLKETVGIEYIGNRAFAYNKSLSKIKIPESIKLIGEGAFAYSSLKEIELSDNIKEISKGAFARTNLRSVRLPSKLEKIGVLANSEYPESFSDHS